MSESVFARKQLKKHGWTDGCGLGREEDGIRDAIKVKIKKDLHGVGHNAGREFTFHWWDHAFNKAVDSIRVETSEDGVTVSRSSDSVKKKDKNALYDCFVKGGTLMDNKEETTMTCDADDVDSEEEWHRNRPSEDHVFQMCGGRTAHKAARFGHKLNGKLKRIEEHEKKSLQQRDERSKTASDEAVATASDVQREQKITNLFDHVHSHSVKAKKKKEKKKDRKSKDIDHTDDFITEKEKVSESTKNSTKVREIESRNDEMLSERVEITKSVKEGSKRVKVNYDKNLGIIHHAKEESRRDKKPKTENNEVPSRQEEITKKGKSRKRSEKVKTNNVDTTVSVLGDSTEILGDHVKRRKTNKDKKRLADDCNHGDVKQFTGDIKSTENSFHLTNLKNKRHKKSRKIKYDEKYEEKKDVDLYCDKHKNDVNHSRELSGDDVNHSIELSDDDESRKRKNPPKKRERKFLKEKKMGGALSDMVDVPPKKKKKKKNKKECKDQEETTLPDSDSVDADHLCTQDSSDLFHQHVKMFVSGLEKSDQLRVLLSEAVEGKETGFPSPSNYHNVTKMNLKAARLLDIYDSDCFLSSHLLSELKASNLTCQKEVFIKFLEIVVVQFQKYMSAVHT